MSIVADCHKFISQSGGISTLRVCRQPTMQEGRGVIKESVVVLPRVRATTEKAYINALRDLVQYISHEAGLTYSLDIFQRGGGKEAFADIKKFFNADFIERCPPMRVKGASKYENSIEKRIESGFVKLLAGKGRSDGLVVKSDEPLPQCQGCVNGHDGCNAYKLSKGSCKGIGWFACTNCSTHDSCVNRGCRKGFVCVFCAFPYVLVGNAPLCKECYNATKKVRDNRPECANKSGVLYITEHILGNALLNRGKYNDMWRNFMQCSDAAVLVYCIAREVARGKAGEEFLATPEGDTDEELAKAMQNQDVVANRFMLHYIKHSMEFLGTGVRYNQPARDMDLMDKTLKGVAGFAECKDVRSWISYVGNLRRLEELYCASFTAGAKRGGYLYEQDVPTLKLFVGMSEQDDLIQNTSPKVFCVVHPDARRNALAACLYQACHKGVLIQPVQARLHANTLSADYQAYVTRLLRIPHEDAALPLEEPSTEADEEENVQEREESLEEGFRYVTYKKRRKEKKYDGTLKTRFYTAVRMVKHRVQGDVNKTSQDSPGPSAGNGERATEKRGDETSSSSSTREYTAGEEGGKHTAAAPNSMLDVLAQACSDAAAESCVSDEIAGDDALSQSSLRAGDAGNQVCVLGTASQGIQESSDHPRDGLIFKRGPNGFPEYTEEENLAAFRATRGEKVSTKQPRSDDANEGREGWNVLTMTNPSTPPDFLQGLSQESQGGSGFFPNSLYCTPLQSVDWS